MSRIIYFKRSIAMVRGEWTGSIGERGSTNVTDRARVRSLADPILVDPDSYKQPDPA